MAQNQLKSGKLDSKRFISPNDPLNSNVFEATEVLGQSETINEQRYNQFVDDRLHGQNPFQKIVQKTSLNTDPLNEIMSKKPGKQSKEQDNQRPVINDAVRDLVDDDYHVTRKTNLWIHSTYRNKMLYNKPNCFKIDIPNEFYNVHKINIRDINPPEATPPINKSNNVFFWTYPNQTKVSVLGVTVSMYPFLEDIRQVSSEVLDNLDDFYSIEIPEGYYNIETFKEFFTAKTNSVKYNDNESFVKYNIVPPNRSHYFSIDIRPTLQETLITNRLDCMYVRAIQTIPIDSDIYGETTIKTMDSFYYYWDADGSSTAVADHIEEVPYSKDTGEYPYGTKYTKLNPTFIVTFDRILRSVLGGNPDFPGTVNDYPIVFTKMPSIGGLDRENINYREFYDINLVDVDDNTFSSSDSDANNITKKCVNFYRFFDQIEFDNKKYVRYAFYICTSMSTRGIFSDFDTDPYNWTYLQPSGFENLIYSPAIRQALNPGFNRAISTTLDIEDKLDLLAYAGDFTSPDMLKVSPIAGRATPLMFYFGNDIDFISTKITTGDLTKNVLQTLGWSLPTEVSEISVSDVAPIAFVQTNTRQHLESVLKLDIENVNTSFNNVLPETKIQVEYRDGIYWFKNKSVQGLRLKLTAKPSDIMETTLVAGYTAVKEKNSEDGADDIESNMTDLVCLFPTGDIPLNSNYIRNLNFEKVFPLPIDKISDITVEVIDEDGKKISMRSDIKFLMEITEIKKMLKNTNMDTRRNEIVVAKSQLFN
jgi:hypothetical protein